MFKRIAKLAAALLLLLGLGLGGMVAAAFATARPMQATTYADGKVVVVDDGYVTCALVDVGGGQWALIDGCVDGEAKAILAALTERGAGPDDVVAVMITHGHIDHTAGVAMFPKAQVMSPASEVPLIQGEERARSPIGRLMPAKDVGARVSRTVSDGEVLQIGQTQAEVFFVPGHTDGSAAWLVHGVLHVGDSAGADRKGVLGGAPWVFSNDVEQNRRALVVLATRLKNRGDDVHTIAFSHAGAVQGLQPLLDFKP